MTTHFTRAAEAQTPPESPETRSLDHPTKPSSSAGSTSPQRSGRPPAFEWVFASNTVLGGVAPGIRDTKFNGSTVPYNPLGNLLGGARWCSKYWLRVSEHRAGKRGPRAWGQGAMSRFGMSVGGCVKSGTVAVIPADQLDAAAALAAGLLRADPSTPDGINEWSPALVREPGRTRLAIRFDGGDDEVRNRFAAELDVEWFIKFPVRHAHSGANQQWDLCEVSRPDDTVVKRSPGLIHLDNEPVPTRLLEIAEAHGNGLQRVRDRGPAVAAPTESWRPLFPDEESTDHDLSRWVTPPAT